MKNLLYKNTILIVMMSILAITFSGCASNQSATLEKETLYKRLGGYDAVAAVVDDFISQMIKDDQLKRHFEDMDKKSSMRTRQLIVDIVCYATGGPCYYTGRDMKTTHTGMGITDAEWDSAVTYLGNTLNKFGVPEKEQTELFQILGPMKPDIVGQ